jgi:fructose-specific phosphotransferase system IIC component
VSKKKRAESEEEDNDDNHLAIHSRTLYLWYCHPGAITIHFVVHLFGIFISMSISSCTIWSPMMIGGDGSFEWKKHHDEKEIS